MPSTSRASTWTPRIPRDPAAGRPRADPRAAPARARTGRPAHGRPGDRTGRDAGSAARADEAARAGACAPPQPDAVRRDGPGAADPRRRGRRRAVGVVPVLVWG